MTDQAKTKMEIDPHAITCAELVQIVTDYLEGSLSDMDRRQFEAHLDICEGCRHHLDQIRMTINVIGAVSENDLAPDARDRLLAGFRFWKSTGQQN